MQKDIEWNTDISSPFPGLIPEGTSSNSSMKSTRISKSKVIIELNFSLHSYNLNQYKHIFFKVF